MHVIRRRIGWFLLDSLWLIGLALYIFAGRDKVPFHGDESTLIAMSRDYFTLVHQHDLDSILYRDPPINPQAQHLRIVNGTIPKMAMGLIEDIDGKTADDLNAPWIWEWSMEQNTALGHMPNWWVLRDARTSSTLLIVGSAWLVFAIAQWTARRRPAAYAASLIYTTTPAVLLNGRRAMMEGAHLCFSVLAVLVAILLVRELARIPARRRVRIAWYAALGVAAGLAVASKHPAAATVAAACVAVWIAPAAQAPGLENKALYHRGHREHREEQGKSEKEKRFNAEGAEIAEEKRGKAREKRALKVLLARGIALALAGVLGLIVFLALNPAWWSDPLHMPGHVLQQREDLLRVQVQGYGGYKNNGQRLTELFRQAFYARPQYYEVRVWQSYVGAQIKTYEASGWAGRSGGTIWGVVLVPLFAVGLIALAWHWRDGAARVILIWLAVTAISLLLLTPLAWQRYYLPLQPPVAVIAGVGAAWIVSGVVRLLRARRK